MMIIFNGKRQAQDIEKLLIEKAKKLKKSDAILNLASLLIGNSEGSKRYLSLKKKAAERIGIKLQVINTGASSKVKEIINIIERLNEDKTVNGIMVQLPLPESFSNKERDKIINSINPEKDVDGMRDDSPYLAPAVRAVIVAIDDGVVARFGTLQASEPDIKVVVVGAKGFVGKKIIKTLKEIDYDITGVDLEEKNLAAKTLEADIIISATGRKDLIRGNMVKDRVVIIDVGSPKGDVSYEEVSKKASFITPVPGGIGPLTISYLLENLIETAERLQKRA